MAKYLLLRGGLVLLKTSTHCGTPIFLKANHQLESRMQEICQSGSEGGAKTKFVPTPIIAQGLPWVCSPLNRVGPEGAGRRGEDWLPIGTVRIPLSRAPTGLS